MLAKSKLGGGMFGVNNEDQNLQNGVAVPGNNVPSPLPASPNPISHPDQDSTPPASPMPDTHAAYEPSDSSDLLSLKQKALESLAPMVNKLDQSPEEKFKTIMMLIQASDNVSLVNQAYEAATQIVDEKERAKALIDVVNEINYFTQNKQT